MVTTEKRLSALSTDFIFEGNSLYIASSVLSDVGNRYTKPFEGEFENLDFLRFFEVLFIVNNKLFLSAEFVKRYLDLVNIEIAEALVEGDKERIVKLVENEDLANSLQRRYTEMHNFSHREENRTLGITFKNSEKYTTKLVFIDNKNKMRTQLNLTEMTAKVLTEAVLRYSKISNAVLIKEMAPKGKEARFAVIRKENDDIVSTTNTGEEKIFTLAERLELLASLEIFFNRVIYLNKFDIKPFKFGSGLLVRNTKEGTQMIGIASEWIAPLVPVSVKLYGLLKSCG